MQMRDSNEHDLNPGRFVDDAVGKSLHLTPAYGAAHGMPSQRELPDTLDGVPRLVAEPITKINSLRVAVTDRLVEFAARGD